jgi:transcriptional regulator with XRE-family HTH domain
MDAGQVLRHARAERGLDQAELARRAGTTQAYVSRVERGVVSPSVLTLTRLLNAMGLRLGATLEPLPHGNVPVWELRRDLRELSAAERVERAMELSGFLTDVAASAAEQQEGHGSP